MAIELQFIIGFTLFVSGFIIGYTNSEKQTNKRWKEDAIGRELAQYNSKTGKWEWKEK